MHARSHNKYKIYCAQIHFSLKSSKNRKKLNKTGNHCTQFKAAKIFPEFSFHDNLAIGAFLF